MIELPDEMNELALGATDLALSTGAPRILGGAESDILDASARGAAILLMGAAGDDILTGSAAGDTLDGGTGSDLLSGGLGSDRLVLGDLDGGDMVDGGVGNDTLVLDLSGRRAPAGLFTGIQGIEILEIAMDDARVVLSGGMATGRAALDIRIATGGASVSTLDASQLARVTVTGGQGAENLVGGVGADTLNGGVGADTVTGGRGADLLDLGAGGADLLRYAASNEGGLLGGGQTVTGSDLVLAFAADDRIALARSGFAGLGDGGVASVAPNAGIVLGQSAVLLLDTTDTVGNFGSLASINAGFGGRLRSTGKTGDSAFIFAHGTEAGTAALYWLRDGNDNAAIDAGDTLALLAVFTGGAVPTGADAFSLI